MSTPALSFARLVISRDVDLPRRRLGRLRRRRRRLCGLRHQDCAAEGRCGLRNGAPVDITERRKNEARNDPVPQNHEVGP